MRDCSRLFCAITALTLLLGLAGAAIAQVSGGKLPTRWDKDVSPTNPLSEYPRPQLVRSQWQSLNGSWDLALSDSAAATPPESFDGKILVPFPYESALSGVGKPSPAKQRLWYRRTFTVRAAWTTGGQKVLLHFGAVNWDSSVIVNGTVLGTHKGGFDEFSFDITAVLKPGDNTLIVSAWNPMPVDSMDAQVVGKQRVHPGGGICYTGATGIWQTVWIEPVPEIHIDSLRIEPDVDQQQVTIFAIGKIPTTNGPVQLPVVILDDGKEVANGSTGVPIKIPDPKLWTPDSPHLYTIRIRPPNGPFQISDPLDSYFAMRKVSLGKDDQGRTRIMLNNQFVFQVGALDQGYWPDGIYTAPTDDALKFDIETAKSFGLNLLRKHAKVEPERWYYWTDKLGMLVWQDMPQCFGKPNAEPSLSDEVKTQWLAEWKQIIAERFNHPSIIVWTTFNEGWGQHDTADIVAFTKQFDSSRLVNDASGWTDKGVGDIHDTHAYPGPWCEKPEENRAVVNGEFGGVTMRVPGHMWTTDVFGYGATLNSNWKVTQKYQDLLKHGYGLRDDRGCSALVYTQLTDVEQESNGLLTYDREVIKPIAEIVTAANKGQFPPMPPRPASPDLVPTSQDEPQTWSYITSKPAEDWKKPGFDATSWKTGPAPFGHGYPVNTQWTDTPGDIWLRRTVTLPAEIPAKLDVLALHDEDVEVYVNGVLAASAAGYVGEYVSLPMSDEGRKAIKSGENLIAVHCRQTVGGQVIDVGITAAEPDLDWRWVHGAVFVPTNCVNEAQMWDEYDPAINDRELHCASIYGINCVRVFLHYDIYLKKKTELLNHIEDFLTRADKYGLKTEFVFFDDCWNQPPKDILRADYKYPEPIYGVHNSRWLVSPGADVQSHYAEHRDRLKAYVQDIVNAHKADPRIAYWETYNEPNKSAETTRLGTDALAWIKETGSTIPVTATGTDSAGDPYAEFKSWHTYDPTDRLRIKGDPLKALCTECMNRQGESVPAIVDAFKGKTGFIIWEFGIGRDNCRFAWDQNGGHPATDENAKPFHGMVYPDGHPWSVDDVKAFLGEDAFAKTPLFSVEYFKDDHFAESAKKSVTPFIDFDRKDERGTGSPDASVGVPKDHYSVRWTGTLVPPETGKYTLHADADNVVKLTVDGKTVIDKQDAPRGETSGDVSLEKGTVYRMAVEYVHATGDSSLHVTWDGPGATRQVLMSATPAGD